MSNLIVNGNANGTSTDHHAASSDSASMTAATIALRKQQLINRRRAFFHDRVPVPETRSHLAIDETTDNGVTLPISVISEDNAVAKTLKRKVVSFSPMPFEKKVADGRVISILMTLLVSHSSV